MDFLQHHSLSHDVVCSRSSPKPSLSQVENLSPITQVVWTWFVELVRRIQSISVPGWTWVVLLWVLMAFPAASLRGAHYEEGTVIALARGAFEDGHWLEPHLYGSRFVERPVLLSWIAAVLGSITGSVGIWSARLPHLAFLLAGGLMVYNLVLPYTRKAPAVFGALCWFASPMVAQKFVTAEPDVTLSVLMFGGFYVWWRGESKGRVSLLRWISVSLLISAAALTKGPQPLAFFSLGVGAYIFLARRWVNLAGLALVNVCAALCAGSWYWAVMSPGDIQGWLAHSRLAEGMTAFQWTKDHLDFAASLIVEWLPGSILLIPAIVAIMRKDLPSDRHLLLAAVLYATVGTLALLAWPGGIATRYAMPANIALAVIGGVLFDRWWFSRDWLMAAANTVVFGLSTALIILGWIIIPLKPDTFAESKIKADVISAVKLMVPGTLYVTESMTSLNVLAYVPAPILRVSPSELKSLIRPALAVITNKEISELAGARPNYIMIKHAKLSSTPELFVTEILPKN